MPLKRAAVPLLDHVTDIVTTTGAANTVVIRDGKLTGDNTDVAGMERALRDAGVQMVSDAALLGAGATAATALAVVRSMGVRSVLAVARDPSRADALRQVAHRVGVRLDVRGWGEAPAAFRNELVISALPPHAADGLIDLLP
jgi:shikimate dehydrogenase